MSNPELEALVGFIGVVTIVVAAIILLVGIRIRIPRISSCALVIVFVIALLALVRFAMTRVF